MALLLLLVLAGAGVLQTLALRRIARERDRATRISDFMVNSFRVVDPSEARGNQVTAREILDRAYTQIDPGLAGDPDTQAQMMMVMGGVYENLGLYSRAEALYRKTAARRALKLGVENTQTLQAETSLGWTLYRRGHYRDSEDLLRKVLAVRLRRWGENNPDTITVMDYLGAVLNEEGHPKEAEALERKALAFRMQKSGVGSADTLVAMNHLALTMQVEGRWAEAESLDLATDPRLAAGGRHRFHARSACRREPCDRPVPGRAIGGGRGARPQDAGSENPDPGAGSSAYHRHPERARGNSYR